jgi:uncharacterized Fe-S cluster-containing radical SAM superfamily protein
VYDSTHRGFNPIEVTKIVEHNIASVTADDEIIRKYYRFRPSRFYKGSATADTTGCNLRCVYCWSWKANTKMLGDPYTPSEVASKLIKIASDYGYSVIRISGGEPTIAFNHVIQVVKRLNEFLLQRNAMFILETNGILIGYSKEFAEILSKYRNVAVRISIKGCSEEMFQKITGADATFFNLQLNALRNLLDYGIKVWPAITISFCDKEGLARLLTRLAEIDRDIIEKIEFEYFKAYPSAMKRLCRNGLIPWISVDVNGGKVIKGDEFRELCRRIFEKENH